MDAPALAQTDTCAFVKSSRRDGPSSGCGKVGCLVNFDKRVSSTCANNANMDEKTLQFQCGRVGRHGICVSYLCLLRKRPAGRSHR
jgi:hypothetical protein